MHQLNFFLLIISAVGGFLFLLLLSGNMLRSVCFSTFIFCTNCCLLGASWKLVFSVFESQAEPLVHNGAVCLLICVHYWISCGHVGLLFFFKEYWGYWHSSLNVISLKVKIKVYTIIQDIWSFSNYYINTFETLFTVFSYSTYLSGSFSLFGYGFYYYFFFMSCKKKSIKF